MNQLGPHHAATVRRLVAAAEKCSVPRPVYEIHGAPCCLIGHAAERVISQLRGQSLCAADFSPVREILQSDGLDADLCREAQEIFDKTCKTASQYEFTSRLTEAITQWATKRCPHYKEVP